MGLLCFYLQFVSPTEPHVLCVDLISYASPKLDCACVRAASSCSAHAVLVVLLWTLHTVNVQSVLLVDYTEEAAFPTLYTGILCTLGHSPLVRTREGCQSFTQKSHPLNASTDTSQGPHTHQLQVLPTPRDHSVPHWPSSRMKLKGPFPAPSFNYQFSVLALS